MRGISRVATTVLTWSACVSTAVSLAHALEGGGFEVHLDPAAAQESAKDKPISGRLYIFLTVRADQEPRFGPNWFAPEPFFGLDVRDFRAGEHRLVDESADSFPDRLSTLPAKKYRVQALLDQDFYCQDPSHGVGNLYSEVAELDWDPQNPTTLKLTLSGVVPEPEFAESRWVKQVVFRSELLSSFHKREVTDRASVVLPASYYDQPDRRYPVVCIIPGFGGSHRDALRYVNGAPNVGEGETEFIRLQLSGNCKWGHHVYADSATNGPRGQSLIEELIPLIDQTYRTVAAPTARFVTGHSSGGWSSLWLQVTYPETFGGVWSTSPDPVDFRDYQQVNLYADPPLSLYVDENSARRPIARMGNQPVLWYDSFGRMDDCLGRGGQLRSFEAVFSPLDEQGLPKKLWDRTTGRIDPAVAKSWEAYDIRLKLERNWKELEPRLKGKLHVTTGELDTFYLEGAVELLGQTLAQLGSDAKIEVVPGKDHGSILTRELISRMRREMSASFLAHHPAKP